MTNNGREHWTDERLDRLASDVEGNKEAISELRQTAETLLQIAQIHQQGLEVSQSNFEALRTDIQGLQLETRRLIEELRNRQNGED